MPSMSRFSTEGLSNGPFLDANDVRRLLGEPISSASSRTINGPYRRTLNEEYMTFAGLIPVTKILIETPELLEEGRRHEAIVKQERNNMTMVQQTMETAGDFTKKCRFIIQVLKELVDKNIKEMKTLQVRERTTRRQLRRKSSYAERYAFNSLFMIERTIYQTDRELSDQYQQLSTQGERLLARSAHLVLFRRACDELLEMMKALDDLHHRVKRAMNIVKHVMERNGFTLEDNIFLVVPIWQIETKSLECVNIVKKVKNQYRESGAYYIPLDRHISIPYQILYITITLTFSSMVYIENY